MPTITRKSEELSDDELEQIIYCAPVYAGYSAGTLLKELWKRYKGMKDLARSAIHGKGCKCRDCTKFIKIHLGKELPIVVPAKTGSGDSRRIIIEVID